MKGLRFPARSVYIFIVLFFVFLIAPLAFLNYRTTKQTQKILSPLEKKLKVLPQEELNSEKIRQEIITLQLQNEANKSFFGNFATLGAILVAVAGLLGAGVGFLQYVRLRNADHLAHATTQLNQLWEGLASQEDEKVANSIAGLQQFLTHDYREFHARIAAGLALSSRLEDKTRIVRKTLRPVLEQALRIIKPEVMRNVSWQGMKLHYVNFSERDLKKFDFHDSILEDSNFSKAKLREARFENAILRGCIFDGADLTGANFENADIRNATFKNSILVDVNLNNTKVLGIDIKKARLGGKKYLPYQWFSIEWKDCQNWREAEFDSQLRILLQKIVQLLSVVTLQKKYSATDNVDNVPENFRNTTQSSGFRIKNRLIARYGSMPRDEDPHVLMLMWEFPPVVSGGGWTAAYHLIKKLRQRGYKITLLVPWQECLSQYPFGYEIDIISAGIEATETGRSAYTIYSTYSVCSEYGKSTTMSRSLFYQVNYFTNKVKQILEERELEFDVIHAHDWLTFDAAKYLAIKQGKSWIAHFHSCESDRRSEEDCSVEIEEIERRAFRSANEIVVPSKVLRNKLLKLYSEEQYGNMDSGKQVVIFALFLLIKRGLHRLALLLLQDYRHVEVIPNTISKVDISSERLGDFRSGRVVFVGRISWQKDPEAFVNIASAIKEVRPDTKFVMYGKGDLDEAIASLIEDIYPPNPNKLKFEFEPGFGFDFRRIKPITTNRNAMVIFAIFLLIREGQYRFIPLLIQEYLKKKRKITVIQEYLNKERKTTAELSDYLRKLQQKDFWNKGFSIIPIQCPHPYTHKVRFSPDNNTFSEYLVQIDENVLPKYEHNSQEFVVMEGSVSWDEIDLAYENATVLVVTSKSEPFGMVILEAMQRGIPVMYPDNAGVAEVVDSGIKFDPRNTEKSKEELLRLLDDEDRWYQVVNEQLNEVTKYQEQFHEKKVSDLWSKLNPKNKKNDLSTSDVDTRTQSASRIPTKRYS